MHINNLNPAPQTLGRLPAISHLPTHVPEHVQTIMDLPVRLSRSAASLGHARRDAARPSSTSANKAHLICQHMCSLAHAGLATAQAEQRITGHKRITIIAAEH
jgi:hypothetical protein